MLLSRAQMWQSLCHRNPLYRYWVGPYADAVAACFGRGSCAHGFVYFPDSDASHARAHVSPLLPESTHHPGRRTAPAAPPSAPS